MKIKLLDVRSCIKIHNKSISNWFQETKRVTVDDPKAVQQIEFGRQSKYSSGARVRVCVHVCPCVFPSAVKTSPDWNKTINVVPDIRPSMVCWGNYSVSSAFVTTSYTILAETFQLSTLQECQLNQAEQREVNDNS